MCTNGAPGALSVAAKWAMAFLCLCLAHAPLAFADLPDVVDRIRPSVVAIGTFKRIRSPAFLFRGTGFAIDDGAKIVTNAHVLPGTLTDDDGDLVALVLDKDGSRSPRPVRVLLNLPDTDLAVLALAGGALPALSIGAAERVREGQAVAFSGFPIGAVLGLSMVTHRGIISSITPIALPGGNSRDINEKTARRLRSGAFNVFQLDATAYPGNSGGPVYDAETGVVVGILNMTLVKSTKESLLERPSGISYEIPANFLLDALQHLPK